MACIVNCIGSLNAYFLVNGITFGMSPYMFTMLASVTMEAIYSGLFLMPGQVIYAKLIPEKVEASMFAIVTGLTNLAQLFVSKMLGNFINLFYNVRKEDLSNLDHLFLYTIVLSLLPLTVVWLLPSYNHIK